MWDKIAFWTVKLCLRANARLFWRLFPGLPQVRNPEYFIWLVKRAKRLGGLRRVVAKGPLISVVMPVYNPPIAFFKQAVESVMSQTYDRWELCIADDASTDRAVRPLLEALTNSDPRIKVMYRETNGHIVEATHSALELASGDYIALMDQDDLLDPHALEQFASAILANPSADIFYSDEDKIDELGRRSFPYFKPDWSPETLLTRMYTNHLAVYRKCSLDEAGRFRSGFVGAQDFDLAHRLTETTDRVIHIPDVLYSWRMHEGSTSVGKAPKPYAFEAGVHVIKEAMARRGLVGEVNTLAEHPGMFIVLLAPVDVAQIATVSTDDPALASRLRAEQRLYVALVAPGVATDGVAELAAWAAFPGVGGVGPRSVSNGATMAAGFFVEDGSRLVAIHHDLPAHEGGPTGIPLCATNLSVPSVDLLVCETSAIAEVAETVQRAAEAFRIAAATLALREAGYRNVLVPHVTVERAGTASIPLPENAPKEWRRPDPYGSPHLRSVGIDLHVRWEG